MIIVVTENCGPDPDNILIVDLSMMPKESKYRQAIEVALVAGEHGIEMDCDDMCSFGNDEVDKAVVDAFPVTIEAKITIYAAQ